MKRIRLKNNILHILYLLQQLIFSNKKIVYFLVLVRCLVATFWFCSILYEASSINYLNKKGTVLENYLKYD